MATFSYDYGTSTVWLDDLSADTHPTTYDLCQGHTARLSPPQGWDLRDLRASGGHGLTALAG